MVCVSEAGSTAKFYKKTYGREINFQFSGNSSGGPTSSLHANCTLPQLETTGTLCDTTAHLSGLLSSAHGAPV